jgi:hypothetical protein
VIPHNPIQGKPKVVTALEEISPARPKPWGDETSGKSDENHRGRAKVHELQSGLRAELMACKDIKEFWDFVRKRTDLRPRKEKVPLPCFFIDFLLGLETSTDG